MSRSFNFTVGAGKRSDPERPGKSVWPHYLTLFVEHRNEVADLANALVKHLAEGGDRPFVWPRLGELVEYDEETDEEHDVPEKVVR